MAKMTDIKEVIKSPDNVKMSFNDNILNVQGENGVLTRTFYHPSIDVKMDGNSIEIKCSNPRKKEKAIAGTFAAHIKNMIGGVTSGFEYKMKTVYSHFPIKTSVEGNDFVIQNFLGERYARKASILEGVKVVVKGDDITVTGIDKEKVGQTVANIERATKVRNRDIRVFQDGVYLINKGGR